MGLTVRMLTGICALTFERWHHLKLFCVEQHQQFEARLTLRFNRCANLPPSKNPPLRGSLVACNPTGIFVALERKRERGDSPIFIPRDRIVRATPHTPLHGAHTTSERGNISCCEVTSI